MVLAESFAHRHSASEVDLASLITNMMPLFRRSEESLFLKDPPIFPPFATIWAVNIGKVRSPK